MFTVVVYLKSELLQEDLIDLNNILRSYKLSENQHWVGVTLDKTLGKALGVKQGIRGEFIIEDNYLADSIVDELDIKEYVLCAYHRGGQIQ